MGREQILGQLMRYHQQVQNTVLLVSHSMEDVAKYADRVLVMNQARIFCYDKVQEVFSRAEELEKIGLNIPQITKIMLELSKKGYPVDPRVYTVEQAAAQLLPLLKKGGDISWH